MPGGGQVERPEEAAPEPSPVPPAASSVVPEAGAGLRGAPSPMPLSRVARPRVQSSAGSGGMMGLGASVVFFDAQPDARATDLEELKRRQDVREAAEKDLPTFAMLEDVLADHWLTNGLTEDVRAALVDGMVRHDVAAGKRIVRRGEEGCCAFVLGSGSCEAVSRSSKNGSGSESDSDSEAEGSGSGGEHGKPAAGRPAAGVTRVLEPRDWLGASMLVIPGRHIATVRAKTAAVLWSLDRASFQRLVRTRSAAALGKRMELLRSCRWLSSLSEEQLGRLASVGRLHCCPVGARTVFGRGTSPQPRCRYVLEEAVDGPDDFDWVSEAASMPRSSVYDYTHSQGPLPIAGSVRPLRAAALAPGGKSPTTVLVEQVAEIDEDDTRQTAERELQLLAISGAAFRWLLGKDAVAELQAAIRAEFPLTEEEEEAERILEQERKEEALEAKIQAEKERERNRRKGSDRPSAAAMSMASALSAYGSPAAPRRSRPPAPSPSPSRRPAARKEKPAREHLYTSTEAKHVLVLGN